MNENNNVTHHRKPLNYLTWDRHKKHLIIISYIFLKQMLSTSKNFFYVSLTSTIEPIFSWHESSVVYRYVIGYVANIYPSIIMSIRFICSVLNSYYSIPCGRYKSYMFS